MRLILTLTILLVSTSSFARFYPPHLHTEELDKWNARMANLPNELHCSEDVKTPKIIYHISRVKNSAQFNVVTNIYDKQADSYKAVNTDIFYWDDSNRAFLSISNTSKRSFVINNKGDGKLIEGNNFTPLTCE